MANALISAPLLAIVVSAGLYVAGSSPWLAIAVLFLGAPVIVVIALTVASVTARIHSAPRSGVYRRGKTDRPAQVER